MRKLLMLMSAVVLTAVFAGCSSVPENPNLSGKWSYQYGKELKKTGSFDLMQEGSKLKGVSNDAEGQFDVKGTVAGSVLSLEGQCPKTKQKYIVNGRMLNENEFEGTYTTSNGSAGRIVGQRQ